MTKKSTLTRRQFLRLAMMTSGSVALAPLLKACGGSLDLVTPIGVQVETSTPSAIPTPDLSTGLDCLEIDEFIYESYKRLLLRDPERLTVLGLSAEYGLGNDLLTDVSDEYIRQTRSLESACLDLLERYDLTGLPTEQALNAEIYAWYLDDKVRRHPFLYNDYPVTPFPYASIPYDVLSLLTDSQPLNSLKDANDYITRLGQVGTKYEQLLDGLQRRQSAGIVLPHLLVQDTVDSLDGMVAGGATSTAFYLSFANKIGNIVGLTSTDKKDLRDQARNAIEDSVIPGHRLLTGYFDSLGNAAPQEAGVWQFPNGPEYYNYLLRHFTTTDAGADELHELGLQHVERLRLELYQEFGRLGYSADEDLTTLLGHLGEDSGMVQGDEALAFIQAALDKARSILDQAFDLPLRGEIRVAGGEVGNFFVPAPRGSAEPSVFYAATAWPQPRSNLPTTVFHEAIPGHFLQMDIARQFDLPPFREGTDFDGYLDGWALYAERLMWEFGAYEEDPYGNLGRLQFELLRAVRVVADTGIHAKRWTYDEAVSFMEQTIGSSREAIRYVGYPAQAVSYLIGYLKILELRQQAIERMRSHFDLKEFHRVLLSHGELPLVVLGRLVNEYIVSKG